MAWDVGGMQRPRACPVHALRQGWLAELCHGTGHALPWYRLNHAMIPAVLCKGAGQPWPWCRLPHATARANVPWLRHCCSSTQLLPKRKANAAATAAVNATAAQPAPLAAQEPALAGRNKARERELKAAALRDLRLERANSHASNASGTRMTAAAAPASAPVPPTSWAKPLATVAVEPPPQAGGGHTLAMHPSLQQLFSSASSSRAANPALPVASVVAAASSTVAAAAPSPLAVAPPTPEGGLALSSTSQFPPVSLQGAASTTAPSVSSVAPAAASAVAAAAPPSPSQASQTSPLPSPALRRTLDGAASMPLGADQGGADGEVGGNGAAGAASTAAAPEVPKLTKAQKKNLKRAERKKKVGVADDPSGSGEGGGGGRTSFAGSDVDSVAFDRAERDSLLGEMCVQALVCRKMLLTLRSLQRLAFAEWQGAAAMQRCGADLSGCVAWLLEQDDLSQEELSARASELDGARGGLPRVDVTEELTALSEVQEHLRLSGGAVKAAVIDASGDVAAAIEALVDQARDTGAETAATGGDSGRAAAELAPLQFSCPLGEPSVAAWPSAGAGGLLPGLRLGVTSSAVASTPWATRAQAAGAPASPFLSPHQDVAGNSTASNTSAITFTDWAAGSSSAGTSAPSPRLT
eukprot:364673-Chlamydomonas_euryale.AAC.6